MSSELHLVSLWSDGGCYSIPDEHTRNNSDRCMALVYCFLKLWLEGGM